MAKAFSGKVLLSWSFMPPRQDRFGTFRDIKCVGLCFC